MNSSAATTAVEFKATITWPVRPAIEPIDCFLEDKFTTRVILSFPATYPVTPDVVLAGISWTSLSIEWSQPFRGGVDAADSWIRSEHGELSVVDRLERLGSLFADALRSTHIDDRNMAVIRSFGVRDWPYYEFGVSEKDKVVRIGVHAEGQFRSVRTLPFNGNQVSLTKSPSFSNRAMLRASDLAESGYPTEAVLIAFGALDAAVQGFLLSSLQKKGVKSEAAGSMLRSITTKRLATYLDGVLMLACGSSLASNPTLFSALVKANRSRNDAIHNGKEIGRVEAVSIINSISDVFLFLKSLNSDFEPGFIKPSFFV